jgi:hypothetical protein
MPENQTHFCSELIQLTTGDSRQIANLDAIGPEGCTVFASQPLPEGTHVRLQCFECPAGIRNCASCRIRGKVMAGRAVTPLGIQLEVCFDESPWSPERWKPRHLTAVEVLGTVATRKPQEPVAETLPIGVTARRIQQQRPRPAV